MGKEALKALLKALLRMAKSRGDEIAGIAKAAGQHSVRIHERAFYRYHDTATGYQYFRSVLEELNSEDIKKLEYLGIHLVREGNITYLHVPLSLLVNPGELEELIEDD